MPGLKQHIIGLCGYASAGKDTVADLLVTHAGFMKIAFADALRAEIAEAFGVGVELLTDRATKEQPTPALAYRRGPLGFIGAVVTAQGLDETFSGIEALLDAPRSPRHIMQLYATEYRRRQDPDHWVRIVSRTLHYRIKELHERNFVLTDCRFPNEIATLRAFGGTLWRVVRPGIATPQPGAHISTNDGSEFDPDATVNNCHDIRHLQQEVMGLFWARDAGLNRVRVEIE